MTTVKQAIISGEVNELENVLTINCTASNQPIIINPESGQVVSPLHFVCNCVFEGKISKKTALHWAAWTGAENVVIRLVKKKCILGRL